MEPVEHAFGVRAVLGDARVDPPGPVPGDDPDRRPLFGVELLEEQVEDLPAVPVVSPDHASPLVVDDHGDVRVPLPVAGLVHADRAQAVEPGGHGLLQPRRDPAGDMPRGPPRDMAEPAHGLLARDAHQPRALGLEIMSEPRARGRPRHRRDHHAVPRAFHSRHVGDQLDPPAAEVLVTPTPQAAPVVVSRAPPPAPRASERRLPGPDPHLEHRHRRHRPVHDPDVLHDHALDVQEFGKYPLH